MVSHFPAQCKAPYDAIWKRAEERRCPNLVHIVANTTTYSVRLRQLQTNFTIADNFDSLADLWSQWYRQYLEADFPRLIIRFEDTIYHLEAVVSAIRDCVGLAPVNRPFHYQISSAKSHGDSGDFVESLKKYATEIGRYRGLTHEDRKYARRHLDAELMNLFGYKQAPVPIYPEDLQGPWSDWTLPVHRADDDPR